MATEKRLIDANECYERAWECYLAFYHHVADMSILRDLLNDCPTVDAVEVVHGRWVEKPYLLGTTRYCSICGQNYGMPHGVFNYCPNCGAKMDGGNEDG